MTVIAYDGEKLAADSAAFGGGNGELIVTKDEQKIYHLNDNSYLAGAGRCDQIAALVYWINQGEDFNNQVNVDEVSAIRVYPDGSAFEYGGNCHAYPVKAPWAAGTGETVAFTAMKCGKTAEEAVELAIELVPSVGGEVRSVPLYAIKVEQLGENPVYMTGKPPSPENMKSTLDEVPVFVDIVQDFKTARPTIMLVDEAGFPFSKQLPVRLEQKRDFTEIHVTFRLEGDVWYPK